MKILGATFIALLFATSVYAADTYHQHTGKTSDDQGMTQRDTDMSRSIREKIMADSSLSVNAQNIKIISNNNKVTLKGAVASSAERQKVESIAKGVAGKTPVFNETTISK